MCHHRLPQSQEAVLIYEQKVIPITLLGISYSDNMFTQDMKSYHVKEQHKGRYRLLFKYAHILTEEANVLALISFLYILYLFQHVAY